MNVIEKKLALTWLFGYGGHGGHGLARTSLLHYWSSCSTLRHHLRHFWAIEN